MIDKPADTGQDVLSEYHILSICQTGSNSTSSGSGKHGHKSDNIGDTDSAASTVSENIRKIDKTDKYPVEKTRLINVSRIAEISDMDDIKSNEVIKREIKAWLKSMQERNEVTNLKCYSNLPIRGECMTFWLFVELKDH